MNVQTKIAEFDLELLLEGSRKAIENFAKDHENETFDALCINVGLLYLNSEKRLRVSG